MPFDLQASPQLAPHHINLRLGLGTRGIIEPAVAGSCERSFAPGDDDCNGSTIGSWSARRERQTRRGVLNWERLSNNKPCSASAYQLNSLVIAIGGDQAAIALKAAPNIGLSAPVLPWPVPRRPEPIGRAQPAARRMPFRPRIVEHQVCWIPRAANCRHAHHEGPQFSDLAPLAASDGASARALNHAVRERKFHDLAIRSVVSRRARRRAAITPQWPHFFAR